VEKKNLEISGTLPWRKKNLEISVRFTLEKKKLEISARLPYLGEEEMRMILEKRRGRWMEARQPTMPATEWPTKIQEWMASSSRRARRSSA
jgi:hypothetical protein